MAEWLPYLRQALGGDEHAEEQALQLLLLRETLTDEGLPATHRSELLGQLGDLDSTRQVFLLPSLMGLLSSPSDLVRRRVLRVVGEWVGPRQDLLSDLLALVSSPTERNRLLPVLGRLADLLLEEGAGVDGKAPFAALSILRLPAFVLSTFVGLQAWGRQQPDHKALAGAIEEFFADEARTPVRELLLDWLARGPMFLRYLLVVWMGETGLSITSDVEAPAALLRCYRQDPDPLVAAEAMHSYARLVALDAISPAVTLLMREFRTFCTRRFSWSDRDAGEALREVSVGLLRALARLAVDHYPHPGPLQALRDLFVRPTVFLDLTRSDLPDADRTKVFTAAVLLHGQNLSIRVKPLKKNRLQAYAGPPDYVALDDPDGMLARHPDAFGYEAVPVPRPGQLHEPLRWVYNVVAPWPKVEAASDLSPLVSPVLALFWEDSSPDPGDVDLWNRASTEVDARGAWMLQAAQAVGHVLRVALDQQTSLDSPAIRPLFDYLYDLASGANRLNLRQAPQTSNRVRLRNLTRRIFLNQLARDDVISRCAGHPSPLQAQLLVGLAESALRSLPGEPTYRWVSNTVPVLRNLVHNPSLHIRVKGVAGVVLRFHAARADPRLREELDQVRLSGQPVLNHCQDALCFVRENELRQLEDWLKTEPLRDRQRMQVAAEQLARSLERSLPDPAAAERWAAVCLEGMDGAGVPFRYRLLQAYARCPLLQPRNARHLLDQSGNARRLLDHLVRTSLASALQFFFDCLPNREQIDPRLLRRLIRLAQDVSRLPPHLRLDMHGMKDRLLRGPVIQRLFAGQARVDREFFPFYLSTRKPPSLPETDCTVAAEGEVLWGGGPGGSELISALAPLGRSMDDVTCTHADLIPTFVHCPNPSAGIRCLIRGRPVPLGTIDLHALPLPPEKKRERLEALMREKDRFWLLARSLGPEGPDHVRVDLGASAAGMPAQPIVALPQPASVDESVLVEVLVHRGKERVLTRSEWTLLSAVPGDLPTHDLRGRADALTQLEQLWQAHKCDLVLKARVREVRDLPAGGTLCLLGAGFTWRRWDTRREKEETVVPAVAVPEVEAPEENAEVFIRPHNLFFDSRPAVAADARSVQVRSARPPRAAEGRMVWGTLHASERNAAGRRLWKGRVGTLELPVRRDDLTGDLGTLFALDALADDHAAFASLAENLLLLRVTDGGCRFSVLDAAPGWQTADVVLAVLSQRAVAVTLLRLHPDGSFLLEVQRAGGVEAGDRRGALPPLGVLARVREGELFDATGHPIPAKDVAGRDGIRLALSVGFGRPRADGAYSLERDGVPFLQVAGEDDANLRCRNAFSPDSLVRVRIVSHDPLELTLADAPRIPGFPLGTIVVRAEDRSRHYFSRAEDNERDALVEEAWRPEQPEFCLTVRQPRENRLFIDHRSAARGVRRLLELGQGVPLRGKGRAAPGRIQALLIGGLWVTCDPLLPYLLPEEVTTEALAWTVQDRAACVTELECRQPRLMRLPANVPEIPFLLEDGEVVGLIVSTPYSNSASRQVGVRWLREAEAASAAPDVSDEWSFVPDDEDANRLRLGHVLRAEVTNEQVRVYHIDRRVTGTVLYEAASLEAWTTAFQEWAGASERRLRGTLLGRPGDGHGWLFVLPPAYLVEVRTEQLSGTERLRDAWKLDSVELDVEWPPGAQPVLRVLEFRPGPLRSWLGRPLELRFRWCNPDRSFICLLVPPDGTEQRGELRLTLGGKELAPVASAHELAQRLFGGAKNLAIACTLRGFDLEVTRTGDGGPAAFTYRLRADLAPYRPEETVPQTTQQKSLEEALSENDPLETRGRAVATGDGIGVRLEHFTHDTPVPLPEEEQTWIRHTGQTVAPGWSGKVIVFRTPQGPRASLRRLPPVTLGEWLRDRRLSRPGLPVKDYRLYYYGLLAADDARKCGREDLAAEGERWVLFEEKPGVSFVARPAQLTFLGEPFDPKGPARGDMIERFSLTAPTEPNGEPGLDILAVLPDISFQIEEFDRRHRGIFFGRVRLVGGQVVIDELRGADFRKEAVGRTRLGRWHLVLQPPDEQQLSWLGELEQGGEDQTVYLKFVRADREKGELVFRLLKLEEAFAMGHLVWVRVPAGADNDCISEYGDSFKLTIRPLQARVRFGDREPEMFVPESLFSTRRGRLRTFCNTEEGRIFLARVYDDGSNPKSRAIKLSLADNPKRPFRLLLSHERCQVIVADVVSRPGQDDWLRVELEEGVFVKLPLRRVDGLPIGGRKCQRGDVLFLATAPAGRVAVTDVLPSNLDYLPVAQRPTLLTRLWGSHSWRRGQVEEGKDLRCNLIGLPQLTGLCQVRDESIEMDTPIPQVAYQLSATGKDVVLEEHPGEGAIVGRLEIGTDNRPTLRDRSGKGYPLRWPDVTCREGSPGALGEHLGRLTWWNTMPVRRGEQEEALSRAEVIARRRDGRASLTALAETPFPVDHLVEQFPTGSGEDHRRAPRRSYVVAGCGRGRLVLEIAPGRYAELPTSLLQALHQGPLAEGLTLGWDHLAAGDVLELERVPRAEGASEEFLPSFRVRTLQPGNGRHLRVPFVTLLQSTALDGAILGIPGPAAIPADHLRRLLRDHVLDLHDLAPGFPRFEAVCKEFARHGAALVLQGRVANAVRGTNGWLHFLDIGVQVPVQRRAGRGDPAFFVQGDEPLPRGAACRARVLALDHQRYELQSFSYEVEPLGMVRNCLLVRSEGGEVAGYEGMPRPGDSVLVYRPEDVGAGDCRVLGYDDASVEWVACERDPFHLQHAHQREFLLSRVLGRPGSALWATVEGVDERRGTFRLSRRVQLEQALPGSGTVGRARMIAPLNDRRLLVEVLGVPTVLPADKLCRGAANWAFKASVETLAQALACEREGRDSSDLEVVALPNGAVSVADVYTLPPGRDEVDAVVEEGAPEGVLATADGCRLFVPRRELAWCDLDADVLARLFRPGEKLRVSVPGGSGQAVFSHIRTRDVRREIAWLRRAGGEPAYMVRAWQAGPGRVVVRGQSRVLLDLICEPGAKVPERFPAFVVAVDDARRVVRLSLEKVTPRLWDLPAVPAAFSLDGATDVVIAARLGQLQGRLASGPGAVAAWASEQTAVEASPRNVRLLLETLRQHFGADTRWATREPNPGERAVGSRSLAHAWAEIVGLITGAERPETASPAARFAAGYWCLIEGQAARALSHLLTASEDGDIGCHADVPISLAQALSLSGAARAPDLPPALAHRLRLPADAAAAQVASRLMGVLATRLWADALRTSPLPLLEPTGLADRAPEQARWADALERADIGALRDVLGISVALGRADFLSARHLAQEIWLAVVEQRLDTDLGRLTDRLLEELHSEEEEGEGSDTRVHVLAAQLCFARGDVAAGWHHLDRVKPMSENREITVPLFWQAWLRNQPPPATADPLLAALLEVLRRSRGSGVVEADLIGRVWTALRTSYHRWVIDSPGCRVVPRSPDDARDLRRWGETHAIPAPLLETMDEVGEGEVAEDRTKLQGGEGLVAARQ